MCQINYDAESILTVNAVETGMFTFWKMAFTTLN